jgi:hypothetical protein
MQLFKSGTMVALSLATAGFLAAPAHAALISGWGSEPGNANGTITEGSAGSFSTTAPTGNLTPRALLPSTLTLTNIGDQIVLSGQVAMAGSVGINGNDSFRFWLVNSNGNPTGTLSGGAWTGDTITGWLGYGTEIGNLANANGSHVIAGRATGNTGGWFSGTGAYVLQSAANTAQLGQPATYNFSETLTLVPTGVNVAYTFADTLNRVTLANNFTDTGSGNTGNPGHPSTTSFNAVGFLQNTSSGGAATFSNVDVSYIPATPEPASVAIVGAGIFLAARRRLAH